jgi:GT2 family glycosyltransferase
MREVGFFDPWFFLYFEDDDLCLRVRRAGHAIMVAHAARVEHHTRQSSPSTARTVFRRTYCMTLSKLYITRKYFGNVRCAATAMRIGLGSALGLLPQLLMLRVDRSFKLAARCAASSVIYSRLRRRHCFEAAD